MLRSWRNHDFSMDFFPWRLHGVLSWPFRTIHGIFMDSHGFSRTFMLPEFHWVPVVLPWPSMGFHGAFTVLSSRVQGAPIAFLELSWMSGGSHGPAYSVLYRTIVTFSWCFQGDFVGFEGLVVVGCHCAFMVLSSCFHRVFMGSDNALRLPRGCVYDALMVLSCCFHGLCWCFEGALMGPSRPLMAFMSI